MDTNKIPIPQGDVIVKTELAEKLAPQELSKDAIIQFVKTMQNIHKSGLAPAPKGFRRVRMPKLILPESFIDHVEAMSRVLEISPAAFYQGLLMDSVSAYTEKTIKQLRVLEEEQAKDPNFISGERNAAEEALANIKKEIELLNEIQKAGKYDEDKTPSENIDDWNKRNERSTVLEAATGEKPKDYQLDMMQAVEDNPDASATPHINTGKPKTFIGIDPAVNPPHISIQEQKDLMLSNQQRQEMGADLFEEKHDERKPADKLNFKSDQTEKT